MLRVASWLLLAGTAEALLSVQLTTPMHTARIGSSTIRMESELDYRKRISGETTVRNSAATKIAKLEGEIARIKVTSGVTRGRAPVIRPQVTRSVASGAAPIRSVGSATASSDSWIPEFLLSGDVRSFFDRISGGADRTSTPFTSTDPSKTFKINNNRDLQNLADSLSPARSRRTKPLFTTDPSKKFKVNNNRDLQGLADSLSPARNRRAKPLFKTDPSKKFKVNNNRDLRGLAEVLRSAGAGSKISTSMLTKRKAPIKAAVKPKPKVAAVKATRQVKPVKQVKKVAKPVKKVVTPVKKVAKNVKAAKQVKAKAAKKTSVKKGKQDKTTRKTFPFYI